ncbi:MAG: ion transporter [Bacteroidetes bacterium SW_11_45_7]|nr:MAG: ion transporter [Bacteroidetes bacterium SW_11_45_7]
MSNSGRKSLKQRIANLIFETNTTASKAFDIALLIIILTSVVLVIIETIEPVKESIGRELYIAEWLITILFTIEYITRLSVARQPTHYAKSFYGIIDLLAILPTYLELLFLHPHYLMVVRALRLLRLFRIFKLTRYVRAADNIQQALIASRAKITVFLGAIFTLIIIIGACMYLIEGPENGFTKIPGSAYRAINTITPVGEAELEAKTIIGKALASVLMIPGYAILAVPTGIVSSEITKATMSQQQQRICPNCGKKGHESKATYCRSCGTELP